MNTLVKISVFEGDTRNELVFPSEEAALRHLRNVVRERKIDMDRVWRDFATPRALQWLEALEESAESGSDDATEELDKLREQTIERINDDVDALAALAYDDAVVTFIDWEARIWWSTDELEDCETFYSWADAVNWLTQWMVNEHYADSVRVERRPAPNMSA
jgi:hypothetical protein